MKINRFRIVFGAVAALAVTGGCDREEGIRTYSAPKDPQVTVAAAPSSEGGDIHFSAPPEWQALGKTGMSITTYRIADNPPLDVTVTPLPAAAGEVLANVNRWRGQLGLPETTQAELSKDATAVKVGGADAHLVDITGPGAAGSEGKPQQRMLAAIVPLGGKVWFFKVSGAADRVGPHKAAFEAMVQSAHVDGPDGHGHAHAAPPDHAGLPLANAADAPGGGAKAPAEPAQDKPAAGGEGPKIEGIESYKLPEGWRVDARPRPMRAASIIVGEGGDLAVTRLGANFGDKLSNINRWRGQAGLGPVKDEKEASGQEVATAQGPLVIYDFAGPETDGANRKRLVVAMTQFPKAETVWFFRLLGPHDVVAKNKPAFEQFVRSLKFAEK